MKRIIYTIAIRLLDNDKYKQIILKHTPFNQTNSKKKFIST